MVKSDLNLFTCLWFLAIKGLSAVQQLLERREKKIMTIFQEAVRRFATQSTTHGKGASLNHVLQCMRDEGWRNLGDIYFFEGELFNAGFGKNIVKDVQYTRSGKAYGRKFTAVII